MTLFGKVEYIVHKSNDILFFVGKKNAQISGNFLYLEMGQGIQEWTK